MSEPVVAIDAVALLLAVLPSFDALVVPLIGDVATAVGVPETVHVMDALGATLIGCGPGAQV